MMVLNGVVTLSEREQSCTAEAGRRSSRMDRKVSFWAIYLPPAPFQCSLPRTTLSHLEAAADSHPVSASPFHAPAQTILGPSPPDEA